MRGHHFDMFYVQTYLLDEIALVFPETAFIRPNTSTIDNILTFISVFCVKALRKFTLLLRRYYRHYSLQTGCCYGSGVFSHHSGHHEPKASRIKLQNLPPYNTVGQIPNNCVLKGMLQILDWNPDSNSRVQKNILLN